MQPLFNVTYISTTTGWYQSTTLTGNRDNQIRPEEKLQSLQHLAMVALNTETPKGKVSLPPSVSASSTKPSHAAYKGQPSGLRRPSSRNQ